MAESLVARINASNVADDRPFLEPCLNEGFRKTRNHDRMGFYLMWANQASQVTMNGRFRIEPIFAAPLQGATLEKYSWTQGVALS